MTRKLPKATTQTFDDIKRDSGPRPKPAAKRRQARTAKPAEPSAPAAPDISSELRLSRAREIVGRYTTYAAVGGIIPIPFVDSLSVVAVIARMVRALSALYEVPFHRDRTRAVVAGIIGGIGQAGAGAATTAALLKTVPGPHLFGSAMSSIASAALARTMGRAFILHFETGGTALEFDPDRLRTFFERERARR